MHSAWHGKITKNRLLESIRLYKLNTATTFSSSYHSTESLLVMAIFHFLCHNLLLRPAKLAIALNIPKIVDPALSYILSAILAMAVANSSTSPQASSFEHLHLLLKLTLKPSPNFPKTQYSFSAHLLILLTKLTNIFKKYLVKMLLISESR